jgi:vitamin K-dependent gamma-carboxylase
MIEAAAPLAGSVNAPGSLASRRLRDTFAWLAAPIDASGLAAFRVLFGLLVATSAARFFAYGWIEAFFVEPRFFFRPWIAPWIAPLPSAAMHGLFALLCASGLLVALGLFYRAAIATVFVVFTYEQLVDVTNYVNHYYLVSVLALLMTFLPLGEVHSLDARRRGERRTTLPRIASVALRAQIGTVYFFAGVAKLEADWLVHAQPLDLWLAARVDMPVLGPLFAAWWAPHAFAWAGCVFDLTIAFLLAWSRTRAVAFAAVVGFHVVTKAMLPVIGMFPVIMIVGATSFLAHDWPRRVRVLVRLRALPTGGDSSPRSVPGWAAHPRRFRAGVLAWLVFAAVQLAVPLRAFAYGGDVLWHEQGMRFSWRVVVREKVGVVTYLVDDPASGRRAEVSPRRYLDARQERELSTQPDLILQLAHRIRDDYAAQWGASVRVRARAFASLNGRPAAPLVDPEADLARIDDGLARAAWILPAPTTTPPFLHSKR